MNWLQRIRRSTQLEQQLDRELQFHIDEHAAHLIEQGIDPMEARRRARIAIGGPEQVKEDCRDARGTLWLEDFLRDVRCSARALRQNAGFTAIVTATLALGIGASTLMFTILNGPGAIPATPCRHFAPSAELSVRRASPTTSARSKHPRLSSRFSAYLRNLAATHCVSSALLQNLSASIP